MQGRQGLDRTSFDSDQEFERAVNFAARQMGEDQKRNLLFSLLRECRGCGNPPAPETLRMYWVRQVNRSVLVCEQCQRSVDVPVHGGKSLGHVVTLWNTTPLTIVMEAAHV